MTQRDLSRLWAAGRNRRDLYRDGMGAFNRGDYPAAIACFVRVADDDTLHGRLARFYLAQSHRHLGLAAIGRGEHRTAVGHFQVACRFNPSGGELARFLAVACAGAGDVARAASPLERALSADHGDRRARIMLAIAQWRSGQSAAAELTLHEGLSDTNPTPEIHLFLGLLAAQCEQWDRVEEHLTRCVAWDESNVTARRYLGLACGAQGRPADALNHLKLAQRLDPSDPHVALELAYAAMAVGAPAESVRPLRVLPAADPSRGQVDDLDRLGRAITDEPEFVQAFLDLEPSPMDPQIFGVLAAAVKLAIASRPAYADLHYYASRVNQRIGRVHDAIDAAERAIAINPRYVAALIHVAKLYRGTAQQDSAADRLRSAIAAGGDYPDVHLLLGDLYRDMGQVARARQSYERALKLNENFDAARKALDALAA
ncbi:MAG: Beta-barrel assembly-enhancing protease [Phycisphaerae bacterium]|nr:Beta-barrel assembly-enhancing protease [Phycisphaerae bacterium]